MLTWIKRIVIVVLPLALLGGAGAWYWGGKSASTATTFRTAKIERGDLVSAIGATGTVEPEEVIDVGSQVTGQILKFGTDADGKPTDYGSHVTAGSLLALIDDTTYTASVLEAKAQLAQAVAGQKRAEADKLTAAAKLTQAQNDWSRAEKIGPGDALAQTTYDTYKSSYDQAQAAVAVADAAILTAKATIDQTESAVKRAQRNLDFCTIKSPVDGVVIDRRVNIGQTVVSTQSASSLFLIAKDLRHMQVWVAVNEADIGQIKVGLPVNFTCDAFGDRAFKGAVEKMRLNASMTQNVVTYTVEVATDNSDEKLLPYLTANVQFEVNRRDAVLMVPNAALRWTPAPEQIVPEERAAYAVAAPAGPPGGGFGGGGGGGGFGGNGGGGRGGKPTSRPSRGANDHKPATLWTRDGDLLRPLKATAGATDGASTEVFGDGVTEGTEIVTGVTLAGETPGPTSTNPFLPQMPFGRGGGGGRPR